MNITDSQKSDFAGPCPRCGGGVPNSVQAGEYPGALSRYDNRTYICSGCGQSEAFMQGHLVPLDVSLFSPEADAIRQSAKAV